MKFLPGKKEKMHGKNVLWFFTLSVFGGFSNGLELPNMSGINRDLTGNLSVDQFFSLWIVFNDDDVQISGAIDVLLSKVRTKPKGIRVVIESDPTENLSRAAFRFQPAAQSDKPFTILAPKNKESASTDVLLSYPDKVKETLTDHMVLGQKLRLDDISQAFHFRTLGGKIVSVQEINGTLYANNIRVLEPRVDVPGGGVLIILEDYLFPFEVHAAPEVSFTTAATPSSLITAESANEGTNSTFFQNLVDLLSFFKNGVRVFQHFLSRSNVSHLLKNDEEYTVLIPTDHAFQRWHPIDWGFYPFSVPEFTESVIINHFISGNLRQDNIKDGQVVKTLGGREIVFTRNLFFLSANGAPIVRGDTPIHHGNLMFISEVLFVSEAEVQKLHQQNKDKETPPLLAFPWFGAQFLSHAFLALERQRRFSHITRFLNLADLAPYVSGKGYTFFVPTDEAFEELGLGKVPDNYLSTGEGLNILLNHFVKGRLYKKHLENGMQFPTLGNKTIQVTNGTDGLYVNDAKIVESEIFVYNLGTMYYINKVLFADKDSLPPLKEETSCENSVTTATPTTTTSEVEKIPEELSEDSGTLPDALLEDDKATKTTSITSAEDLEEKITTEVSDIASTEKFLENTEMYKPEVNISK